MSRKEKVMISVMVLNVDGSEEPREIQPTLEGFRSAIGGGYIEVVRDYGVAKAKYPGNDYMVIVDEEGLLKEMPTNQHFLGRALGLVGPILLVEAKDWED